jgi:hypothetical protein
MTTAVTLDRAHCINYAKRHAAELAVNWDSIQTKRLRTIPCGRAAILSPPLGLHDVGR